MLYVWYLTSYWVDLFLKGDLTDTVNCHVLARCKQYLSVPSWKMTMRLPYFIKKLILSWQVKAACFT